MSLHDRPGVQLRSIGGASTAGSARAMMLPARVPDSLLNWRVTWWLLGLWTVCYGLGTWALEAILLLVVPGAPYEPWYGVFRVVQTVLWVGALAIAIAVAERWPIESVWEHRRRIAGQIALGLLLGLVWGVLAYWLSARLMPAWQQRGLWGVVATEAKGALFGFGITITLVHAVIHTLKQRAREIQAAEAVREATEARLSLLKLELQPETILHSMKAVEELIPRDVAAANEALVLLAETLHEVLLASRVQMVSLGEELAVTDMFVRLRALVRSGRVEFSTDVDEDVLVASVPHLILHPLIDDLLEDAAQDAGGSLQLLLCGQREGSQLALRLIRDDGAATGTTQPPHMRRSARMVERLSQLYGDDYELRAQAGERNRPLTIELRIPFWYT